MSEYKKGITNATIAYTMWGIYPLYWWLLQTVSPVEVLINRMLWSFITLLLIIIIFKKIPALKETIKFLLKNKKKGFWLFVAALIISVNWFVFTYAAVSGLILEASLGYYMNPIVNILIAVIFLKERLTKTQAVATMLAAIGVIYLAISYGVLPWVSIILACSFSLYALSKRLVGDIDPIFSLFLETLIVLPLSLSFFTFWILNGNSSFLGGDASLTLLLIGAGGITVSPLFFFSKATQQIPFKVLSFLQYVGPTIQIVVAVFIVGEYFSAHRLITFIFIWMACLIFSSSHFLHTPKTKKTKNVEPV